MKLTKKEVKNLQRELRQMLNDWDLLEAVHTPRGPQDEYDCLGDRLISQLILESSTDAVVGVLKKEIKDHFGLNPKDYEITPFAVKVTNWFNHPYKK